MENKKQYKIDRVRVRIHFDGYIDPEGYTSLLCNPDLEESLKPILASNEEEAEMTLLNTAFDLSSYISGGDIIYGEDVDVDFGEIYVVEVDASTEAGGSDE